MNQSTSSQTIDVTALLIHLYYFVTAISVQTIISWDLLWASMKWETVKTWDTRYMFWYEISAHGKESRIKRHKYWREMCVPWGDFEQNISVYVLPKSCLTLKEQHPMSEDWLYCETLLSNEFYHVILSWMLYEGMKDRMKLWTENYGNRSKDELPPVQAGLCFTSPIKVEWSILWKLYYQATHTRNTQINT
jgi:hypothetical protein